MDEREAHGVETGLALIKNGSDDLLISLYLQLRQQVEEIEESHKRELAPYKRVMDAAETEMTSRLLERKSKGTRGETGRAELREVTRFTVSDRESFFNWVIDNGQFDWLTSNVSDKAVETWRAENPDKPLPPFLNSAHILKTRFVRNRSVE